MILIGLSGKKLAGKDSFYHALKNVSDIPVIRIALADDLKDEVYQYVLKPHGIEREALDSHKKKFFRLILQGWGTDFKRNLFGNDYWLTKLQAKLLEQQLINNRVIVVITDVRFKDEAEFIRQSGGILLRIDRPPQTFKERILRWFGFNKDKHPSECDLDKYKHFYLKIKNNKTLNDLDTHAERVLKAIL